MCIPCLRFHSYLRLELVLRRSAIHRAECKCHESSNARALMFGRFLNVALASAKSAGDADHTSILDASKSHHFKYHYCQLLLRKHHTGDFDTFKKASDSYELGMIDEHACITVCSAVYRWVTLWLNSRSKPHQPHTRMSSEMPTLS